MRPSNNKDYWEERARRFGGADKGYKAICSYGMPGLYNAYIDKIQKKALKSVLDVKREETVLDLGCGIGRWSLEMAKRGAKVTAADLSNEMIKTASARALSQGIPIQFIVSSIADLKVEPGTFDKALAVTVLQHILSDDELKKSIEVISRALKPGGFFILMEAAPEKETKKLDTDIFTARTLGFYKKLCMDYGLSLVDVRSVDPSPFKKWLLPYYKKMPIVVKGLLITVVALLSLATDIIFAGTRHLIPFSWHKVMVFKKI